MSCRGFLLEYLYAYVCISVLIEVLWIAFPQAAVVDFIVMDLNDLSTVHSFAAAYLAKGQQCHLLVNNAGVMNTPYFMTSDGFEGQFQANHLGHFLLTHLLMPALGPGSRVVCLASRAHLRWGGMPPIDYDRMTKSVTAESYDGWQAYGLSKACNILFAKALAKRFPLATSGITFNALHPGTRNASTFSYGERVRQSP